MKHSYKALFFILALLIISANAFSSRSAFAQDIPQSVKDQYNLNSNSSFFEIRDAMNAYWASKNVQDGYVYENGQKNKVPGWKLFKRWEYYWEQRVDQVTGKFPKTNAITEYEKYMKNRETPDGETDNPVAWTSLGSNTTTGGYAGIGRINCITFHPTDVNTFWVGSPSGGIWKTINGGSTWTILNNTQTVLGVSDIVVDQSNTNILYIATGDRDGGSMWSLSGGQSADNPSIGVLKSINGGTTWTTTGLTYTPNQFKTVYSLLIHPSNSQILFASTSDGIYKSVNGGTTWSLKANTYPCWRLAFKPGNPLIMYGTEIYGGSQWFQRSVDGGDTWTEFQFGSGADASRTELAVTAADPNVVYLLTANGAGGLNGVYKSVNSGVSFTKVNLGSLSMLGYESDGSGPNTGQGTYDLCIAASPTNANLVFIGGVNTWKSTNGGANWTCVTHWCCGPPTVVHADKHALAFQNGTNLFEGNDGGIYKTTNAGSTYTDLSNGLVISQLYRIGVSQTNSSIIITGLQDNGSKLFNGVWADATGGDGMECIVDYSNSNYMYTTYQRGLINRSVNGGVSFPTTISENIPGGQPAGAWVSPYVISPSSATTLFVGYDKVWKTVNRGDSWTSASQVLSSGNKLRALAIAPSNANVLYAASGTSMWKTVDGGATNWTAVTPPTVTNSITYIAVKNTDPNTLWITYGGYTAAEKVYKSVNGGSTWTNVSTGLPNLPVMCVVYDKSNLSAENLYVGTDAGVYMKDGASNWAAFNTGLPTVVVTELEIYYGSTNKLRAGTFGRGLWETALGGSASAPPCEDFTSLTFPPSPLAVEFAGTNYWSRNAVSAYGIGSGSAKFAFYDAVQGTVQSIVSNNFTAAAANTYLTFDEAYAPYTSLGPDTLIVEASSNSGSTYTVLATLLGKVDGTGELNTAPPNVGSFTPANSQWRPKIYLLPVGTNKVRLKAKSGYGNNLYIDNMCVQVLPVPSTTNFLGITPQGFYRGTPNIYSGIPDTVTVYLHRVDYPNVIVDSVKRKMDALTSAVTTYSKALSGTYYQVVKHRNSIETWSASGGQTYTRGAAFNYDFLSPGSAFNNNQFQVNVPNNLWGMFGGDIDRNYFVDATDVILISNAATAFTSGYVQTDVTGDNAVDLTDIVLTHNNSTNFVQRQAPVGAEPTPAPQIIADKRNIVFENDAQRQKYEAGLREQAKLPDTELKTYVPNWDPMPTQEYLDKLNSARIQSGKNSNANKQRR